MRTIDWSVIGPGVSARATKQVMESEQIARREFMLKYIKGKLGNYDATKVYMFGAADMTYWWSGGGYLQFSAPTGGLAFYNGEIYTIPVIASEISSFDSALAISSSVVAQATMSTGTVEDIVSDKSIVVSVGGAISIEKIVPLFIDEVTTPWVTVDGIRMRRVGNYLRMVGSVTMGASSTFASWSASEFNAHVDRMYSTGDYVLSSGAVNRGNFPTTTPNEPVGVILTYEGGTNYSLKLFSGKFTSGDIIEIDASFTIYTQ